MSKGKSSKKLVVAVGNDYRDPFDGTWYKVGEPVEVEIGEHSWVASQLEGGFLVEAPEPVAVEPEQAVDQTKGGKQ